MVFLATSAAVTGQAPKSERSWRSLGPEGGEVRALLVDPAVEGRVYAGTLGGRIFVSSDDGDHWRSAAPGLFAAGINDLALAPGSERVLWAATDRGVYRLPGGARVWEVASTGLPPKANIGRLAIDPRNPTTLYATVDQGRITGVWKVYRSTDGGESWADVTGGLLIDRAIAIAPTSPPTLYAGDLGGVRRTTDGGSTWSLSSSGLPDTHTFWDLVVDPVSPSTIYAVLESLGQPSESVFKSVDGGVTWNAASQGLEASRGLLRLTVEPRRPETLYLAGGQGVFRSTDGAGSWSAVNVPPADRRFVAVAASPSNGAVFVAPYRFGAEQVTLGVLRSQDGGESWQALTEGLAAGRITALSPDPRGSQVLVVSTEEGGVRRSEDGGATWAPAEAGLAGRWVGPLARDPLTPSTLYALTGSAPSAFDRLHRSTDGGATWEPLGPELGCCLEAVVPDPGTPGGLYVVARDRIFQTKDGGGTWAETSVEGCFSLSALAPSPSASGSLLVGCWRDSGLPVSPPAAVPEIRRSVDGGASWERVFEGELFTLGADWTFALDPSDPSDVLAGLAGFISDGGVFRSRDGGATWQPAGLEGERVQTVLFDPRAPDRLFAGTGSSGVLRSTDDGASWAPFNRGLGSAEVRVLAVDPLSPARLFAGTGGGLFVLDVQAPARPRRLLAKGTDGAP